HPSPPHPRPPSPPAASHPPTASVAKSLLEMSPSPSPRCDSRLKFGCRTFSFQRVRVYFQLRRSLSNDHHVAAIAFPIAGFRLNTTRVYSESPPNSARLFSSTQADRASTL